MASITTFSKDLMAEFGQMLRWWRARDKTGDHSSEYPRLQAPDDYIAYTPSGGIPGRAGLTIEGEECTIYIETGDIESGTMELEKCTKGDGSDYKLLVYNTDDEAVDGNTFIPTARLKSGVRYTHLGDGDKLVELCLSEAHPGRGIVFDAIRGVWDTDNERWKYDSGENEAECGGVATVKAIDWRYGVPYPAAGAKGLFVARVSTKEPESYTTIYECVSLDCESPGDCCTYGTGGA